MNKFRLIVILILTVGVTSQLVCIHTDSTGKLCKECIPSYYLNLTTNYCVQCNITGCSICSNSSNNTITCLQCDVSYTLVNGTCYYCPPYQYYNNNFTNVSGLCQACPSNCLYCVDNVTCFQCADGYSLNVTTNAGVTTYQCISIANFSQLTSPTMAQYESYLLALMPSNRATITNSQDLSYICYNNLYSCLCANLSITSRCENFDNDAVNAQYAVINGLALTNDTFPVYSLAVQSGLGNTGVTKQVLSKISGTNFTFMTTLAQFSSVFQLLAKLLYDGSSFNELTSAMGSVSSAMINSLSLSIQPNETVTLQGNGFIYRMSIMASSTTATSSYPKLNITYSPAVTGGSCMLLIFNRSLQSQPFSGTLLLYQTITANSPNRTIFIPRLSSLLSTSDNFQLLRVTDTNNQTLSPSVSSSSGTFSFTSNDAAGAFAISSIEDASIIDIYANQRIENMFYKPSIFYILFFFLLYVVFVPLCMFVDFVDSKQTIKRKRAVGREVTQEQLNIQQSRPPGQQASGPSDVETEIVVPISYKQFHPIYNIATTQDRPMRIAKLCLYLLNLQHSLFYLVVLYNAAPTPRTALLAILMVIPAYILNILSCYLFGFIKNQLPGKWKFMINIVPPCYWIAWFFLINQWTDTNSPYYQIYLIIFVVICQFLDQVFDLLQMMIMFFVLRENNQVYPCISKVLSARGYFEYDKYSTQ